MGITVGIPRALGYYAYHPIWMAFFDALGIETVVTPPTTKGMLDAGVKDAVMDACVPIKVFHGHVAALKDKVDYIFVPRLVNVEGSSVFCPKFLGLPEMVRFSRNDLPPLIDIRIDLRKGFGEFYRICLRVGRLLNKGVVATTRAYLAAVSGARRLHRLLRSGLTRLEALEVLGNPLANVVGGEASVLLSRRQPYIRPGANSKSPISGGKDLVFALLGYPYAVFDPYISVGLVDKLKGLGVTIVTPPMLHPRLLRQQGRSFSKLLFWLFSDETAKGAYHFINDAMVDGVIHVTAFGCGPDSLTDKLLEMRCADAAMPYLSLMIDEHSGEAGIATRLEAFADMVRRSDTARIRTLTEHQAAAGGE